MGLGFRVLGLRGFGFRAYWVYWVYASRKLSSALPTPEPKTLLGKDRKSSDLLRRTLVFFSLNNRLWKDF